MTIIPIPKKIGEILNSSPEVPARMASLLAKDALWLVDAPTKVVYRKLPKKLRKGMKRLLPGVNPEELYLMAIQKAQTYLDSESDRSPYERIMEEVIEVVLTDGRNIVIRAPSESDRMLLSEFYTGTLTKEDKRSRFFGGISSVSLEKLLLTCSNPEVSSDFVAVDDNGEIVGHCGYVNGDNGAASLHIVISQEYQGTKKQNDEASTEQSDGISLAKVMFGHAISVAKLDPRVKDVVAETESSNPKSNGLVRATMPKGATVERECGDVTTTFHKR